MVQRPKHPRHTQSWRWWLAERSAVGVLAWVLGTLLSLAILMTAIQLATTKRGGDPLALGVATFRALLGQATYVVTDSLVDQTLASIAAVIGASMPAIFFALVFLRIFWVQPFVWRKHGSICLASDAQSARYRSQNQGSSSAIIAIRLYQGMRSVMISRLTCRAYLRYWDSAGIDKSRTVFTAPLKLLDVDGSEVEDRLWGAHVSMLPLTLWIPLQAPLIAGRITEIQGREVLRKGEAKLLIQLTGKINGLGMDVVQERLYDLESGDLRLGRFVPVHPDSTREIRTWEGWDRFDDDMRQCLFLYGSFINLKELSDILRRDPVRGVDYVPARMSGHALRWNIVSDNTDPSHLRAYYNDQGQIVDNDILFVAIEANSTDHVDGIVVMVTPDILGEMDEREAAYSRTDVSLNVETLETLADGAPDIVWAYIGKPSAIARAQESIKAGRAIIHKEYLDKMIIGAEGHGPHWRSFDESIPSDVPVVSLERRPRLRREE